MKQSLLRVIISVFFVLLLAPVVFAGGEQEAASGSGTGDYSQPLSRPILWYLRGSTADTEDIDTVNLALNELLASQGFNAGVQVSFINRPDYNDRMSLMNSSGELFDLSLVTESWVNTYPANVRNEFLLPLSAYDDNGTTVDLLKMYAPNLWVSMSPGTWEAARIEGEIYAIPNQQIYVQPFGISIRKDIVEELGLDNHIKGLSHWRDLDDLFTKLRAGIDSGSLADLENGGNLAYVFSQYDYIKANSLGYDMIKEPWVVKYDDQSMRVVNFYQTDEFKEAVKLMRRWYEAGYCPKDHLEPQDAIATYVAGQSIVDLGRLVKPGGALEQQSRMGYSWTEKNLSDYFISNAGGPTATMTGVNSIIADDGNRVKVVMKFIDIVNSDKAVYNLIAKGVAGKHYEWVDEDRRIIKQIDGSGYKPNVDWAIGNQFNAYYVDEKQLGAWEATQKLNLEAPASVMMGFRFDGKAFDTENASITAIVNEYFNNGMKHGYYEDIDATIAEMLVRLDEAGAQTLKAGIEEQIQTWLATKN